MYKLGLKEAADTEIKLPRIVGSWRNQFQKNMYFCFIDYPKAFVQITNVHVIGKQQRKIIQDSDSRYIPM